MQNIITDSIRYWESRRLAYNAVLAMVLCGSFFAHHAWADLSRLPGATLGGLALAAVLANILYCAAYLADLFVQMSAYQPVWRRYRWMLLTLGTFFAAGLFLLHE
jgi:hypothetical protein